MNAAPHRSPYPWLALSFRLVLFAIVQVLIAQFLLLVGAPDPWRESARWWVFTAIITNGASILLLVRLYRAEGRRYWDLLRIQRSSLWSDGAAVEWAG